VPPRGHSAGHDDHRLLPRPDARSQNRDRVRKDTDSDKVAAIVAARAKGTGVRRIARDLGVGVGTVLRVTGEAALATIGPSDGANPF
jgi:hypothetical protein